MSEETIARAGALPTAVQADPVASYLAGEVSLLSQMLFRQGKTATEIQIAVARIEEKAAAHVRPCPDLLVLAKGFADHAKADEDREKKREERLRPWRASLAEGVKVLVLSGVLFLTGAIYKHQVDAPQLQRASASAGADQKEAAHVRQMRE